MTSKERLNKSFKREKVDRVAVAPLVNANWLTLAGNRAQEFIRETDLLMDMWINTDIEIYLGAAAYEVVEKKEEGNTLIEIIHTPKGDLTRVSHCDANMLNWVRKPFFEESSDIKKFLSLQYIPVASDIQEFNRWGNILGDDGIIMALLPNALCLPGLWMSSERFLLLCIDDFLLLKELLEISSTRINIYAKNLCRQGVRYFRIAGAELASQTLMGPGWFEKLVVPYDSELVKIIHQYSGIAFYHCHGKIRAVLDKIADIGIDVLSPIEAPPSGDVSIEEVQERIGDRVCLMGNLDDFEVIGKLDYLSLNILCHKLLDRVGKRPGFILGGTESGVYTPKILEGFLNLARIVKSF